MSQEKLIQLREIIFSSGLSQEQKEEFYEKLSELPEVGLEPIVGLLIEEPDWVEKLYQNYTAKKEAFENGDREKLDQIIENELEEIEE